MGQRQSIYGDGLTDFILEAFQIPLLIIGHIRILDPLSALHQEQSIMLLLLLMVQAVLTLGI